MSDTQFLPQETIRALRDGREPPAEEIARFIAGLTDGRVGEGQAAAFAMAVFFRGLSQEGRVALTRAMTESGRVLAWDLPGPVIDKHSTGGVGDCISLALAPAVAACGGYVPMISGRGLGHTGGTLDKLDSIPGYVSQPGLVAFRETVREAGCAIIGQTADLAPADRRLYAIRDVTATVESIDLITASILSKKLAAGLDGLVMDVKTGSGAFMADLAGSQALAQSIVAVAEGAGLPTRALITDMNEPLAPVAGNACEVTFTIAYLKGAHADSRFHAVNCALGGAMLALGGLARDASEGEAKIAQAVASGAAAERFARMVTALGGPADLIERPEAHLASAPVIREVVAPRAGYVSRIATREIGLAVVALGGGRVQPGDEIDHRVGVDALAGCGVKVDAGTTLARVHARDEENARAACARILAAFTIADEKPAPAALITDRIGG
jgi:thymidine phosphorylase